MAVLWSCPTCHKMTGGSADNYGHSCDDCSGVAAAKRAERERWIGLSADQKIEELKARLDAMQPVIDAG